MCSLDNLASQSHWALGFYHQSLQMRPCAFEASWLGCRMCNLQGRGRRFELRPGWSCCDVELQGKALCPHMHSLDPGVGGYLVGQWSLVCLNNFCELEMAAGLYASWGVGMVYEWTGPVTRGWSVWKSGGGGNCTLCKIPGYKLPPIGVVRCCGHWLWPQCWHSQTSPAQDPEFAQFPPSLLIFQGTSSHQMAVTSWPHDLSGKLTAWAQLYTCTLNSLPFMTAGTSCWFPMTAGTSCRFPPFYQSPSHRMYFLLYDGRHSRTRLKMAERMETQRHLVMWHTPAGNTTIVNRIYAIASLGYLVLWHFATSDSKHQSIWNSRVCIANESKISSKCWYIFTCTPARVPLSHHLSQPRRFSVIR